ncbi:MAG: CTP synthase, partial [Firmicutes bacterium]|nr:CTP synthase [Bacillota bacterium]
PDIIVCRSEKPLMKELRDKIGLFCNISGNAVIQNLDAETLYEVPLMLENEGLAELVCKRLNVACDRPDLTEWAEMVKKVKNLQKNVTIALVGKYVALHDAYFSIVESLKHGGLANDSEVEIKWVNSENITEENSHALLKDVDGILVPGGFGDRGVEGKVAAAKYARENNIPYFGICLGMQVAVIEVARNLAGLEGAHSSELNPQTPYPVIDLMPEQKDIEEMGGTMRLGLYPCKIEEGTKTYAVYKDALIYERHRHRYEVNNEYREQIKQHGLITAGLSPDQRLVEIVELSDHPWYIGVQFHPEFKSRPNRPHPLFKEFIRAALQRNGG